MMSLFYEKEKMKIRIAFLKQTKRVKNSMKSYNFRIKQKYR